jgi:hypothetical protein
MTNRSSVKCWLYVAAFLTAPLLASAQSTSTSENQFLAQPEIQQTEPETQSTESGIDKARTQLRMTTLVPMREGSLSGQGTSQAAPSAGYQPITGKERLHWFVMSSVGPQSLGVGVLKAGMGTAGNHPPEYGTHWDGFGKRYGIRLSGVVTSHAMEGTIGALWGEDPRYFRASGRPLGGRMKQIVVMTFAARRPDGHLAPAYARYIAKSGSNFLSNTWRVPSDSSVNDALIRTAMGFLGKMMGNAFQEFWPDVAHRLHRKR